MIVIIAVVAFPPSLQSQQLSLRSSVILRGTIVTSSRVFNNPDALTAADRDHYDFVDNLLGGGLEYHLDFPDQYVFFSISVDYDSRISSQSDMFFTTTSQLVQLPVAMGVRFVPIELGVGTHIPLIENTLRLNMGGGFGIYYADRVYGIGGVRMKSETLPVGYGIHIESGFTYMVFNNAGLCGEMRFRDPEIINESRFGTDVLNVDGYRVSVGNIPPKTKINVHGVTFSLGIILNLD
jgi:hypothetical protein